MNWRRSATKHRSRYGFTIVELLIVIVIIGILAAITIVAYQGISGRAQASAAQAALSQANKKLEVYKLENNGYPIDQTAFEALGFGGPNSTDATRYEYRTAGTGMSATYCITATNGTTSYRVDTSTGSNSVSGACAGHGSGGVAAITNHAANPSAVANTAYFGFAGNGAATKTFSIASDQVHHGTTSFKIDITGAGQVGLMAKPQYTTSLRVNAGEKLSWSFWAYSTKAGSLTPYQEGKKVSDNTYTGATGGNNINIPANQWTKISGIHTATLDSYVEQIGAYNLSVLAGDVVWFDEFMVTKTSTPQTYADGQTANWVWNGTPNASSSTGGPLP